MEVIERRGHDGIEICYLLDERQIKTLNSGCPQKYKEKVLFWIKDIFLPHGYPYSVSPDYLKYQLWDCLQAYCSNLSGALSLHSTFVSIGVGKEAASPLAAALSWLIKDGTGMLSSIVFAYWKACDLDNNSKQWRLFADIANDAAHFLKLLAPYLPIPFVITLCISSVISSLVGVAGGCTRSSLTQHQALNNNMADVSAKDGSQETMVNLAGLITSLTLLPLLTSTPIITWLTFLLCVILHIFSNFQAMRTIEMRTINRGRLLYILQHWIKDKKIPNISNTNQNEPLMMGPAFQSDYLLSSFRLELGVSIAYVFKNCAVQEFKEFSGEKYMLFVNEQRQRLYVVFNTEATSSDFLKGFLAAYLYAINKSSFKNNEFHSDFIVSCETKSLQEFTNLINQITRNSFSVFFSALVEAGWKIEPLRLNVDDYRVNIYNHEDKKDI